MTASSFLRPRRDSAGPIRLGVWLYAVALGGSIVFGFVGPAEVAGAILMFSGGLGWYFVAVFSVLDRRYLDRVDATWSPERELAWGCLIPFLNAFSGYFYLRERRRHVPTVVDLQGRPDHSRHA